MTVKSSNRGHSITAKDGAWDEADLRNKPCVNCGQPPTEKGYDACISEYINELNRLGGITTKHSCCGHGHRLAWVWCEFTGMKSVYSVIKWINPDDGEKVEIERAHGDELMQLVVHINTISRSQ